jgi:hypothetical protein
VSRVERRAGGGHFGRMYGIHSALTEHPLTKVSRLRQANDNSGYIGAGIVGSFVLVVGGWYGGRWVYSKWK